MNRRQVLKAVIAVPITVAIGAGVRETTGLSEGWLGHQHLYPWQREFLDRLDGDVDYHRLCISAGRQMGKSHQVRLMNQLIDNAMMTSRPVFKV